MCNSLRQKGRQKGPNSKGVGRFLVIARALVTILTGLYSAQAFADSLSELASIKSQLKKLEYQFNKQKQAARQEKNKVTNFINSAHAAPQPIFIDLRKGLFLETEDKKYAFKFGGRLIFDGGGIAGPSANGWQGNVSFRQAFLELEGKLAGPWFWKFQYDLAGATTQLYNANVSNAQTIPQLAARGYVQDRNFLYSGIRDIFIGIQDPRLSAPFLAQPVYFKIGNQFEGFSLQGSVSYKFLDLFERPMAIDAIAPNRHLGASFGMIGKENWTSHFGIYTISPQDMTTLPANTPSANAGNYVLSYSGNGITNQNWYQPYGGGAYWEATGRITYAPIFDEHRLLHIGASGSFHQPNSSTGYSDDRNMLLGHRVASEMTTLNLSLLGTPDLSCGRFNQPSGLDRNWNSYNVSGNCVNNIEKADLEAVASWHNLSFTGEWTMANYNRNSYRAQQFALAQQTAIGSSPVDALFGSSPFISPAMSRYFASGYYIQGEWWITGEEKAQSYDQTDKNGANFAATKIKDKFSDGGWGAWGLVGRLSALNLNNGPYQGSTMPHLWQFATLNPSGAPLSYATQAYMTAAQNMIANSGIYGGYQQNLTAGLNWYPDNGINFQANVTHVLAVKSPLNWNQNQTYESGYHPTLIGFRTRLYF